MPVGRNSISFSLLNKYVTFVFSRFVTIRSRTMFRRIIGFRTTIASRSYRNKLRLLTLRHAMHSDKRRQRAAFYQCRISLHPHLEDPRPAISPSLRQLMSVIQIAVFVQHNVHVPRSSSSSSHEFV